MTITLNWQPVVAYFALGVILLVALIVAGYLFIGLFNARSLVRKEFAGYFVSPIAYVVLVVFLGVTGYLFSQSLDLLTEDSHKGVEYPMQAMFGGTWFWTVFLFIPPLLTMRLFAEERGSGTLEVLMTTPLRDWQVVLSKYAACFGFYVFMWLPTLVYLPILLNFDPPVFNQIDGHWPFLHITWTIWNLLLFGGLAGIVLALVLALLPLGTWSRIICLLLLLAGIAATIVGGLEHYSVDVERFIVMPAHLDPMPVWSSYLGLALVGAMFLALGMFISSLVRSQMIAALISMTLSMVFLAPGFWQSELNAGSMLERIRFFISVPQHFTQDFCRGVVDTRHVVLYVSVALFSLFLTVRSLEVRRWR